MQSNNRKKTKANREKNIRKKNEKIELVNLFCNILFYVFMLSILLGASLMALMQQQDKGVNGYRMFGVLTNSMVSPDDSLKKDGFRSGDILVIKKVSPELIEVGDVITYHPATDPVNASSNYLTHRVININTELGGEQGIFYTTRGDANQSDDMPINSNALVGKVVYVIPKIGGLLRFIKENWVLSSIFIISVLGFVWVMRTYILVESVKKVPPVKRKKKKKRKRKKSDIIPSGNNINQRSRNRRKKSE